MQYQSKFSTQTSNYKAEIAFFTQSETNKIVKSLFADASERTRASQADADLGTVGDARDVAESAIEALLAMFRQHKEFHSQDAAEAFVLEASGQADPEALRLLYTWTHELLESFDCQDGLASVSADSLEDLQAELEKFLQVPEESDEPSCWPLVELIRSVPRVFLWRRLTLSTELDWTRRF